MKHARSIFLGLGMLLPVVVWVVKVKIESEPSIRVEIALKEGNIEEMKLHLKKGVAADGYFHNGLRFIDYAIDENQPKMVEFLLNKGAEIKNKDALHAVCKKGSSEMISLLLNNGFKITDIDSQNDLPIHNAVLSNNIDAVKVLLRHGAKVNSAYPTGSEPIHLAALQGNVEMIKFLMSQGAKETAWDKEVGYPVHLAVCSGHLAAVKFLIETFPTDINIKSGDGYSLIHYATKREHPEVLKYLIQKKANLNDVDKEGYTPLHRAAAAPKLLGCVPVQIRRTQVDKFTEIASILINAGADINISSKDGQALHLAIESDNLKLIELLLNKNARLEVMNPKGLQPIHIAAATGNLAAIKLLVAKGARVNSLSKFGTPFEVAESSDVRDFLRNNGHRFIAEKNNENVANRFIQAAVDSDLKLMQYMLTNGVAIDIYNKDGFQAIHAAAQYGTLDGVKFLLAAGAKVDAQSADGLQPLSFASSQGQNEVVKLLLAAGAPIDGQSTYKTAQPLHCAAGSGKIETVKILVAAGAKMNDEDAERQQPIHWAVAQGKLEMVKWLVQNGADLKARIKTGETPLDISTNLRFTELSQWIKAQLAENQKRETGGMPNTVMLSPYGAILAFARPGIFVKKWEAKSLAILAETVAAKLRRAPLPETREKPLSGAQRLWSFMGACAG